MLLLLKKQALITPAKTKGLLAFLGSGGVHALVVLLFFSFPFVLFPSSNAALNQKVFFSPFYWLFSFSLLFLNYFNFYFLIPKFYLQRRFLKYAVSLLGLFIFYLLLRPTDLLLRFYYAAKGRAVPPIEWLEIDLFTCIFFIIVVSTGTAIQVIRKYRCIERRAQQAETAKAQAELSFLKAQVNPHFLFNTLNNIYSLSEDQHPETSGSILKLSNIMRYITDETSKDLVPLEDELACISDYIELQKLRLGNNITVIYQTSGNPQDIQIAPLILITYIENAFKYGISAHLQATITIKVIIDEAHITFFCQNPLFPATRPCERAGIGLENTRQRLKFLYPEQFQLITTTLNGFYTVELKLATRRAIRQGTAVTEIKLNELRAKKEIPYPGKTKANKFKLKRI